MRPSPLPLVLALILPVPLGCGAVVDRAEQADAQPAPDLVLVVPGSAAPDVDVLELRGPAPLRPGVYVFTAEGAPADAPALQLRVVPEGEARAEGEHEVVAPSTAAARWTRRPTR